ncbi:MAG: ABC transporter substrate-binding protein [Deltaproteobacteria bacterium]|nr:ABC transporter substrate-binding protein [Deltaproteobacteria bacterium]
MTRRLWIMLALILVVAAWPLTATAAGKGQPGGVFKVGIQPLNNLDPHFIASISDIMVSEQQYHHLTFINEKNKAVPDLATEWKSADGKVWVFALRSGVKFSNGKDLTAKDVVFSFNRMKDPKVGSPAAKLYNTIEKVEAVDDTHVQFTLSQPNPEFPADAGDYHSAIIPDGSKDPGKVFVGSGPYMITSYLPEDRVILKKNPHFKQKSADGDPLPYFDEIQFIISPDLGGQVEALRGGQLNFVAGMTTEFANVLSKDPKTKVVNNYSNMHWALHMRSDGKSITADNKIRQALKLATDHQAIINAVRPGLAVMGNGFTPVGPSFSDYYLDKAPKQDLAKAKQLLAEAGKPNGFEINLIAQNIHDVVPFATVWKEQMAKIGVKVNIQVVPSDVYYGEGETSWLKCDFGITDWGSRATPVTYFKLAYNSDGAWNESHWKDAEFDELSKKVDQEMDRDKRVVLYQKLQQILIDRGPVIIGFFEKAAAGAGANVENAVLPSDWARVRFWEVYYKK